MSIIEMLEQSGIMALVGMGVVFSFLIILVIAISISSSIIRKFEKTPAVTTVAAVNNGEVLAAISAAVTEYRKK